MILEKLKQYMKLPEQPKEATLKSMDIMKIIQLANESPAFKANLIKCNLKDCHLLMRLKDDLFEITVYHQTEYNQLKFVFFNEENGAHWLEKRDEAVVWKLGELKMPAVESQCGDWVFVTNDHIAACMKLLKHLRIIFPRIEIALGEVWFQAFQDIGPVCDTLRGIRSRIFLLQMYYNNSAGKAQRLMAAMGEIDHLKMYLGNHPVPYEETIIAKKLEISTAFWVTNDKIVNWKFEKLRLTGSSYQDSDVIALINMWKSGAIKMETIKIPYNRFILNRDRIVEGTKAKLFPCVKKEIPLYEDDETIEHYVKNKNGKVAIFRAFDTYFRITTRIEEPVVKCLPNFCF